MKIGRFRSDLFLFRRYFFLLYEAIENLMKRIDSDLLDVFLCLGSCLEKWVVELDYHLKFFRNWLPVKWLNRVTVFFLESCAYLINEDLCVYYSNLNKRINSSSCPLRRKRKEKRCRLYSRIRSRFHKIWSRNKVFLSVSYISLRTIISC